MAKVPVSKTGGRKPMWVRVPPPPPSLAEAKASSSFGGYDSPEDRDGGIRPKIYFEKYFKSGSDRAFIKRHFITRNKKGG